MIDCHRETAIILDRLADHFKKRPRTIYQLSVAWDPYEGGINFFILIHKLGHRQRSIPLHTVKTTELADFETIMTEIKGATQISVVYAGFDGLRWPSSNQLIT
ncbi:hypothetical protein [Levilactobacillus bambusae]|uniref:Acetyl-CoA carboxylase n=1 Tax=Levilactobacillus bambusae TaxID=2024736 RepID=A0A2V1MZ85_9LACO|nr:hypothetical protein [Levilactobacillus bambusae]PWG00331.1 hypothetical protein DCM90_05215 [Levilactobacillus bambusae]